MIDAISRRTFLAASAAASGAAASRVGAAVLDRALLVAVDHRLEVAQLRGLTAPPDLLLDHALVRMWRDRLSQSVRRGSRITAYTRWDLSLLLADLAREDGFALQQSRVARGVLMTDISYAA